MRRLFSTIAIILVPAAGLLLIGAYVVGSSSWVHERVRDAVARYLADTTRREVRVGEVSGSLLNDIRVQGVAIAAVEGGSIDDGAVLSARDVYLHLNLLKVIKSRVAPAAAVSRVLIDGLHADVLRRADGTLNITDLLPKPGAPTPPEKRFAGLVTVKNARVRYTDELLLHSRDTLALTLDPLDATVDMTRRGFVAVTLDGSEDGDHIGRLSGRMTYRSETKEFAIDADVSALNLAWAHGRVWPGAGMRVTDGLARVRASVVRAGEGGASALGYSAHAAVHPSTLLVKGLTPEKMRAHGELWVTPQGLYTDRLDVEWAGSDVVVDGGMAGFEEPVLDFHVDAPSLNLAGLLAALPAGARDRLPDFAVEGPVRVEADIAGSLEHAGVQAVVALPDALTVRPDDAMSVVARKTEFSVALMDTANPAGCATLSMGALDPGEIDLAPARSDSAAGEQVAVAGAPAETTAEATWPRTIGFEPLEDVRVRAQWAGDIAQATTSLHAGSIRADGVEVNDLAADVAFIDDTVYLRNVRADAMGADVTAQAVVDLSVRPVNIYSAGVVSGLDLARLAEIPVLGLTPDAQPAGRADAEFGLQYTDGALFSMARVTAEGLEYDGWSALRAGALLSYQGSTIGVQTAFLTDAIGTMWARGELALPRDQAPGALDLEYQVAEVKLDEIGGRLDYDQVGGVLYARGAVAGPWDAPEISADAALFEPGYGRYGADTATATAVLRDGRLAVTELLARRGTAALTGGVEVSGLPAIADLSAQGVPESAGLTGQFSAAGIHLDDVVELLEKEWEDVDGLAEVTGEIAGTVGDPLIGGQLRVAHALTSTANITEGLIPFSFRDRVLEVRQAKLTSHGSELVADAKLDFSTEVPVLSAGLSAGDIRLEGIRALQERGWELAGIIQIPHADVHGPLDALAGEATLTGEQLQFGDEPLRQLRAELGLDDETVRLKHLQVGIARGELAGSGEYVQESGAFSAAAHMESVDLSRLLASGVPLVNAIHSDDDRQQRRAELVTMLNSYSLRAGGELTMDVVADGTIEEPRANADLKLARTVFEGQRMPDISVRGDIDRDGAHGVDLEAVLDDMLVTASGDIDFDDQMQMLVQGSGIAVEHFRKWIPLKTALSGQLGFTVVASGQTAAPNLMGSVDILEPEVAGLRLDLISAPLISVKEGGIDVDTLIVRHKRLADEQWVTEAIEIDGSLPFSWDPIGFVSDEPIHVGATVDKASLALVPVLLNEYLGSKREDAPPGARLWSQMAADGSVHSEVTVSGTPAQPVIAGNLTIDDGVIAFGGKEPIIHDASVNIEVEGDGRTNTVTVNHLLATVDDTSLSLGGTAELSDLSLDKLHANVYDLALQVTSDAQTLGRGFVAKDLQGTLALRGGGGQPPTVYVDQLGASLGEGHIFIDGTMDLENFRFADLAANRVDLALIADNSRIWSKGLVDAVVDGAITIAGPGGGVPADVTGLWTISHGRFGIPASTGTAAASIYAPGSSFPKPNFDVRLAFGPDMTFAASGVRAPLRPTTIAHLTGTLQQPVLTGLIEAQAGRTQIPGGVATIQSLGAGYKLAPAQTPLRRDPVELAISGDVWGLAETVLQSALVQGRDIGPVTIEITLSGTLPDQFEIRADSSPSLAEEQIYALLGTAPLGYLTGSGAQGDLGSVLSDQFLGALAAGFQVAIFEPIEQELRRTLGLSELSLNFAFNQPVEIRLGKYLMEDLLVSYRTAFGGADDEYDLTVSYVIDDRTRVSYTTDERDRHRIQVERVWQF